MDVVVTVPRDKWIDWCEEGDAVGDLPANTTWGFFFSTQPRGSFTGGFPDIKLGERVYVVAHGLVRGYAPLTAIQRRPAALGRRDGAVAVTIPEAVVGFPGWRYRWWDTAVEVPFPDWKTREVDPRLLRRRGGAWASGL